MLNMPQKKNSIIIACWSPLNVIKPYTPTMNQLQYIHSYLIISPLYYPIFIPMKPSAKSTGAIANLLFVAIVHLNGLNGFNGRSLLGPGSEMTGRWGWWLAGFDAHDFWGWKKTNLRRGDTKGSCVTGDAGDHSVRKPTCDRALFCWHQALGLSIWTSCASKSPLWQNEGKISVQPKHGEAPTFLCFTRLLAKVKVTWQMDVEKSESQVEWWWWWWWCWWWDAAKGLLREETHKACDESSLGGGHGNGHSEQSGDVWIRKESTPRCPWLLIT